MYETIVLPLDGSSCATRALDHAISLAGEYDAELHLIYVVQETAIPSSDRAPEIVEQLTAAGDDILSDAEERARDARLYQVSTHLRRGRPAERILELVDEQDADLVVMGTHGRAGIDRHLLGSKTKRVLRQASAPVMAVHALEREG